MTTDFLTTLFPDGILRKENWKDIAFIINICLCKLHGDD